MFLIFDTETTGLPRNFNAPISDSDNWPRMVQISWQLHDDLGKLISNKNFVIKPEGFEIPYDSQKIHGISTEFANNNGIDLLEVLQTFNADIEKSDTIIGHNINFDINIVGAEFFRKSIVVNFDSKNIVDTMRESVDFCKIQGGRGGKFKFPKLGELYKILFNEEFDLAHNSAADVEATARCFFELVRNGEINQSKINFSNEQLNKFREFNTSIIKSAGVNIDTNTIDKVETKEVDKNTDSINKIKVNTDLNFTHLHVHTQYSILDGAANISNLAEKALKDNMKAIAITDHGNMFGAKLFHQEITKKGLKPIIGCEFYVARRGLNKKTEKIDRSGDHLIVLAKNLTGYKNITKLISTAWLEGMYFKPRIDKELLAKHSEGLIVLSACLGGEIPQKIMKESTSKAEESALWFKNIFGDDYYLEIQRHKSDNQEVNKNIYNDQVFVNSEILKIAQKLNIKIVATNDSHYVNKEDFEAQQRLICISTNTYISENNKLTYSGQEWFKTQSEMIEIFKDIPQAIISTQEITDKIEEYSLERDAIMPEFDIPKEFANFEDYKQKYTEEDLINEFSEERFLKLGGYDKVLRVKFESDYLEKITYEGAKTRWDVITDKIKERIDFELSVIKKMGFPGYFLIVWDFLKAARNIDVIVGPGRGSAAGSVVAYSLKITDIDPLKYNLLFERFLNPDRISMPDIDIDFDDDGRAKILKWVVDKYGEKRVAHIITFGTMAAKSAIRDVARVQQYPLFETNKIAKLVPEKPGTTLKEAFKEINELNEISKGNDDAAEVLKYAQILEGSIRNTGTHACGIIIGKDDLENYIPVCTAKGSELKYVTQYDGKLVESIGLLKMDFLGLKTLSIIKETIDNIKLSKNETVDIGNISLEDEKTYELYSKGQTTGLFQFESDGMKKHLIDLKPSKFEDLIAMNALYRPGPMEYIPSFIKRKHGVEKIQYDVPMMSEYLEETYGITVYQEQVMLLSRKLANFTRGESDTLRKAMGKKKIDVMNKLKIKFIEGCKSNPQFVDEINSEKKDIDKTIEKIWNDWEAFAKYAFNKSHATCYSYISYQTAYLKAHYPAEFMAAVLSKNNKNIDKITFFINECKNMGIKVLGPDVNESYYNFTVNKKGNIRFGLAAIKDVGGNGVETIIEERKNGEYKNVYNFIERVKLTSVNKKTMESLAYAGAFDDMGIQRNQFFDATGNASENSFIIRLLDYGNKFQSDKSSGPNLFGDVYNNQIETPGLPNPREWNIINKLQHEKEKIGIYLSSHPLDSFKLIIDKIKPMPINKLNNLDDLKDKEFIVVGYITNSVEFLTKKGVPYGKVTIEDLSGITTLTFLSKKWEQWKEKLKNNYSVAIKAKVEIPSWKKEKGEYDLNINKVDLLYNIKNQFFKNIEISINIEDLNTKLIDEINQIITNNAVKGTSDLKFIVKDINEGLEVNLTSKSIKIDVNDEIIEKLSNKNEFSIKIN